MEKMIPDFWEAFDRVTNGESGPEKLYRLMFSAVLTDRSGLDRLDGRLADQGIPAAPTEEWDEYRARDLLGLRYFYLRSPLRLDRLDGDELAVLEECLARRDDRDAFEAALRLVNATFRRVFEISPDQPTQYFELFRDIHGRGNVQGNALVIVLQSAPDYDENGMFRDEAAEERRLRLLESVARQTEPILARTLDGPVRLLLEI